MAEALQSQPSRKESYIGFNVDPDIKRDLRIIAAHNGISVAEQVRRFVVRTVSERRREYGLDQEATA